MLQFSRTLLSIGADRAVYLKGLADKPGNGKANCSGKTNRRYQMGTISILFPNQIFFIVVHLTGSITPQQGLGGIPSILSPLIFAFIVVHYFICCLFHDICLFDLSSFSLIF